MNSIFPTNYECQKGGCDNSSTFTLTPNRADTQVTYHLCDEHIVEGLTVATEVEFLNGVVIRKDNAQGFFEAA